MARLVAILNTEHNMELYKNGSMTKKEMEEMAAYKELSDECRKYSFREALTILSKEDCPSANEAREYLMQHNGRNLICEVRAYESNGNRKRNQQGSEVIGLEEKISGYIDSRKTDAGKDYDCLEITVDLYSDVGA